jgi:hypothetical protein
MGGDFFAAACGQRLAGVLLARQPDGRRHRDLGLTLIALRRALVCAPGQAERRVGGKPGSGIVARRGHFVPARFERTGGGSTLPCALDGLL